MVILVASFAIEAAVTPLLLWMFPVAPPDEAAMSHNQAVWLFTFGYTLRCVVAAGYVTARLAPRYTVRHALILGILQSALTIPAMLEFREKAPLWGWILSMVVESRPPGGAGCSTPGGPSNFRQRRAPARRGRLPASLQTLWPIRDIRKNRALPAHGLAPESRPASGRRPNLRLRRSARRRPPSTRETTRTGLAHSRSCRVWDHRRRVRWRTRLQTPLPGVRGRNSTP
jgi:hypothetical protein